MVKKWDVTIPSLTGDAKRKAYIYLPASYQKEPEKRYPVLYMFDGHNVFFDSDATYGKSWGMNEFMRRSRKQLIIVAVECNHVGNGRLREYSPFTFEDEHMGKITGQGKKYMDWLVKVLKPYIDRKYRTLPQREYTMIAGSSMGGLMSLYAVTRYNHIFQRAACLSPSLWVDMEGVLSLVRTSNIRKGTCIYMDYGREEMGNHLDTARALAEVNQSLLLKHVDLTFRIVPGGTHCEASWEKQIPIFMECLGV